MVKEKKMRSINAKRDTEMYRLRRNILHQMEDPVSSCILWLLAIHSG